MDDVTRLLAYEEIRQLAARYALAIDSRDLDALVALFVDDVRVGRELEGRAALKEDFDSQLRDVGVSILFVGNHVIDIEDEQSAKGSVYCKAEIQVGERWVQQAILYRDRYAKRGGHWYFVRRIHLLWYGKDAQENPLDLGPANWPENHTGRGTLPESWQSWKQFWETQED
jgi:ketosteroid isomerase-like protein